MSRRRLLTFATSDVRSMVWTEGPEALHGMNVSWIHWTEENLAQYFAFAGARYIPLDDFHSIQLW